MTCYLRNGTASPEALPCDYNAAAEGRHTSCCNPNDLCLSNGMCRSHSVNNLTNYAWTWGCTDPTYADPVCGNYCDKWSTTNHQLAFSCDESDTWCCYKGAGVDQKPGERINRTNTKCCSVSEQVFKAPWATVIATATFSGTPLAIATLMSDAPSDAITTISTSSAAPTATGAPNTPPSTSNSLAIGLGVGLGGGAALIALALGWVFMRRRKRRNNEKAPDEFTSDDHMRPELSGQDHVVAEKDVGGDNGWIAKDNKEKMAAMNGYERVELQDTELSAELTGDGYRVELPGSPVVDKSRAELK